MSPSSMAYGRGRKMVSRDTTSRLRWHAGLEEGGATEIPSISSCTWPANTSGQQLDQAVADFLVALATLNRELNGTIPSEGKSAADAIPRDVAYAVAEVTAQLREHADAQDASDQAPASSRAAWQVETAWRAVLAGDIDDIEQHLREEERMRAR